MKGGAAPSPALALCCCCTVRVHRGCRVYKHGGVHSLKCLAALRLQTEDVAKAAASGWRELVECATSLGLGPYLPDIECVLAGILHLGNMEFQEHRLLNRIAWEDGSVVSGATSEHLEHAAALLGVTSADLQTKVTFHTKSANLRASNPGQAKDSVNGGCGGGGRGGGQAGGRGCVCAPRAPSLRITLPAVVHMLCVQLSRRTCMGTCLPGSWDT